MLTDVAKGGTLSMYRRVIVLLSTLLSLALGSVISKADTKGLENAVASHVNETVTRDLDLFFRQMRLTQPAAIDTKTRVQIDERGTEPLIKEINLEVTVVTDQPPQVMRKARHRLIRLLRDQGYRLDPTEGNQPDIRPFATLTIEAVPPAEKDGKTSSILVYAGFVALILALLASLGILIYVLVLPLFRWRRVRKSKNKSPIPATQETSGELPPIPVMLAQPATPAGSRPLTFHPMELPPIQHGHQSKPAPTQSTHPQHKIEVGGWSTLATSDDP